MKYTYGYNQSLLFFSAYLKPDTVVLRNLFADLQMFHAHYCLESDFKFHNF